MKNSNDEKVIKPPVKPITSGTIFKPSKSYLRKLLLQSVIIFVLFWVIVIPCFASVALMAALDPVNPSAIQIFNGYLVPVSLWTLIIDLLWFVPAMLIIPPYVRSIEYSVKAESGDTMPEIYSKRGIITITRRHVPFRTITNISSQAGPFDRLFKIGSVRIETAGYSGANQKGPEENLSGIVFYEEVRDFILVELRKFKEPYTTGTEVVYPTEEVRKAEGLDNEVLTTLREIRDILRQKK